MSLIASDSTLSVLKGLLAKLNKAQTLSEYQMSTYQRILEQRQVVQSMSRKGNCLDNAAMESFFGVLKSEYFYLNKFKTIEELEKGLAKYIRYYNYDRIKLKLKGLSPVQYRNQPLVA